MMMIGIVTEKARPYKMLVPSIGPWQSRGFSHHKKGFRLRRWMEIQLYDIG